MFFASTPVEDEQGFKKPLRRADKPTRRPKTLPNLPKTVPRRLKTAPRRLQDGPKTCQDAPRRPPRAPPGTSETLKMTPRIPKMRPSRGFSPRAHGVPPSPARFSGPRAHGVPPSASILHDVLLDYEGSGELFFIKFEMNERQNIQR